MKKLLVLLCLIFAISSYSQDNEVENLMLDLTFQDNDTTKVNTSLKIIKILYESENYDRALNFIKRTEKKSEEIAYENGLANVVYYKALIFKKKDDYINALSQYKKAKSLFSKLKDTISVSKVNSQLGVIEIERGNYGKGLRYALSAIKVLEKKQLNNELASTYKSLAKAYQNNGTYEKAIDYNLKSLEVEELINDTKGLIVSNKNLAQLYLQKEDYNKAIRYYENALNYANTNDNDLKAEILPELGSAYIKIEDYKIAADYLVKAIRLNRKLKNEKGILNSLNNLGELNLVKRNFKIAENQLLEAGNLGRQSDNTLGLLKNYKLMKSLDSTRGDFEGAFGWQNQIIEIQKKVDAEKPRYAKPLIDDSELNESFIEDDNVVIPLTSKADTDKNLVEKERLDRLKLIFYALLAAFAIVLVFFVLFYMKRNTSAKYTRDLEAKNQKIELQNEAILEQSKHLENINKVKDKLFSIVSHDLKDSLTSTKGFIDLLKEGQLSQEEFHNLLPELSENANNASLLLFNLLNWSKSQMQSLKPKPSLFDVQEVFYEKIKLIEQKMQTKGVLLIDNTLRDFIYADKSMVEIIIQNLLANAVKFCKSGDTITIANTISNSKAIFSVSDSGVGISTENQQKLFGNNTFTTIGTGNEKGTGLGLTICRELVELNDGRIWVDSEINKGSTFFVELPKTRVEDPVNT
ncbi:tetratricopeptide repeat-containing sensor histidine kinase [uncultured Lacinutrix sp.]|uniref:tetratricopeptide repeat-containing sensor histidine kinase n=1 Tax=uncultured Lacinutrix sp. TaxID=574032 RepID=UPI00263977E8|nr:tetratricopeptide repeat-containing sensor histidine kinase [uncultured Lacinutrix sp.]